MSGPKSKNALNNIQESNNDNNQIVRSLNGVDMVIILQFIIYLDLNGTFLYF
jgi:hypothetical protein